jgi:hypothetical protein
LKKYRESNFCANQIAQVSGAELAKNDESMLYKEPFGKDKIISDISEIKESREYFDDEKERIQPLKEKYNSGLIKPTKKMEERTEQDGLYFDSTNNIIFYPEKVMTDDELVTIIDFDATINNFISCNNDTNSVETELTSENAVSVAKNYISSFYGYDLSNFVCVGSAGGTIDGDENAEKSFCTNTFKTVNGDSVTVIDESGDEPFWTVVFQRVDDDVMIFVDVRANDGSLLSIDTYDNEFFSKCTDASDISEKELSLFKEEAKKTVGELCKTKEIVSTKQYIPNPGRNSVYTLCELNTGEYYEVELSYPECKKISCYYYGDKNTADTKTENKAYKILN